MTPDKIAKLPYRLCVGVVILNAEGQVFVGQRKDRYKDAWQMPQGGIDEGEDPKTAALREMWEETGIDAGLVDVIAETDDWLRYDLPDELIGKLWKGKYRGQEQKWFLLRFNGTDDQIDIETSHPEFGAWKWSDLGDVVANIVPFKRDVYVKVADAFREYM